MSRSICLCRQKDQGNVLRVGLSGRYLKTSEPFNSGVIKLSTIASGHSDSAKVIATVAELNAVISHSVENSNDSLKTVKIESLSSTTKIRRVIISREFTPDKR